MKYLLIASLALFTVSSFARGTDKSLTMAEKKQMMTTKIDQKMESLQESKTCVGEAMDDKALMGCKQDMKEAMEDVKEEYNEKRKDLME